MHTAAFVMLFNKLLWGMTYWGI